MKSSYQFNFHSVDALFVLTLLWVFAATCLLAVISGARVYRSVAGHMDENYSLRVSTAYIGTKLRQTDLTGAIRIEALGDGEALVLERSGDGASYQTWIYLEGGQLREVLTPTGQPFDPAAGQPIAEMAGFSVEKTADNVYVFCCLGANGRQTRFLFSPRTD
jgi:hypothetical protein